MTEDKDHKDIFDLVHEISSLIPEEDLAKLHPKLSQHDVSDLNRLLWEVDRLRNVSVDCIKMFESLQRELESIQFNMENHKTRFANVLRALQESLEDNDTNS